LSIPTGSLMVKEKDDGNMFYLAKCLNNTTFELV